MRRLNVGFWGNPLWQLQLSVFLISVQFRQTKALSSEVIPPQLRVYPVPGFTSALDCGASDYIPVDSYQIS